MSEFEYDPEKLADQLDAIVPSGRPETPPWHNDPLIDAAARLAAAPRPAMRAAAKDRIRAQVVAAHREQIQERPPVRRAPTPRPRVARWAAVAGLATVITLTLWLTPAVSASVPGDTLYPLKWGLEQVELALASSAYNQASVWLTHAERRVLEAQTLLARGQLPVETVTTALDDMAAAARAANADATISAAERQALQARTIEIAAEVNGALAQAEATGQFPDAQIDPLAVAIAATEASGALLLPPPPMPTDAPSPVPSATFTSTPTVTPTLPPTDTPELPTETASPSPTPLGLADAGEGFPVAVVIEGVIEAVDENGVRIEGEVYPLSEAVDPSALTVGEVAALTVVFADEEVAVNAIEEGTVAARDHRHPVGVAIAEAASVDYEEVMRLRETERLGFGHIARAYMVAAVTGTDVLDVIAGFVHGESWEQILWENDLDPIAFTNGRIMSAHGTFEGVALPPDAGSGSGAPGHSGSAPAQSDDNPGNSEDAPGQSDDNPGNSEDAPGHGDDAPGNSENAPGHGDDGPGNSENAPGQNKDKKKD